jgi:prolyl-tRNA synthetase
VRLSRYFLPVLKETPGEAQVVSHQLMLRAGMIRQTAAGIYAWLPMGLRVLRKIEAIVREEQDNAGAVELLMPVIQSAELWKQSGRYDAYGPEMLRIKDRHDREMLFSPTAEELFTTIFANGVKSYRDLPRILYQIQWKFRDEIRPRFGVMRGREFLMKDAYSFDVDEAGARHSYNIMVLTYIRTFARLGIRAIPMQADTGPIGGNLSHEFIVLAETGESEVFHDSVMISDVDDKSFEFALTNPYFAQETFDSVCSRYAATSEKRDLEREAQLKGTLQQSRGIEVGQVFYFGTKYSAAMGLSVQGADGTAIVPHMGSYGIGVSRLMGAIVEASHDKDGIIWPDAVAPYKVALINLRADDAACLAAADALYDRLSAAGVEVLYDDRDERGGAKFATADLIGVPWQVVIGPKGVAAGTVEVKRRGAGTREEMSFDAALMVLTA